MKALRWLFIAVGLVVILVALAIAVGSMWLNSFIHSDAFRQEVETRAGQTLGGTVQIVRIDFNVFTGVKLSGLVTQIDPSRVNGQGAVLVKVESVDCTYSPIELLNRQLKLTGLTLEKPQIVLTRQPASAVTTPPAPSDAAVTGQSSSSGNSAPFQFILEAARVHGGSLSVRDATGASMADLQGIDVAADTTGYETGQPVTGKLNVTDVTLPSNVHVTSFSTPFSYHAGGLDAKPIAAAAFGGNLAGDYASGSGGPSILQMNAKGLDMGQITQAMNTTSPARLSGSLDVQSKWQGVETGAVNGEGDALLTNGRLQGVPILTQLAGVLRVKELNDPVLNKVQTHFQIANGQTRFTGLQLDSAGAFQMTGDGVIGSNGSLDANMVLILSANAMGRMPKEASGFFVQKPDGSGSIAFHVGGTTSNPQTDLLTRLFIQNMQIQNVVNKAFNHFFHKHQQDQTPPANPAPAPGQ